MPSMRSGNDTEPRLQPVLGKGALDPGTVARTLKARAAAALDSSPISGHSLKREA